MAKQKCVLCGNDVSWVNKLTLPVYGFEQTLCGDCYLQYQNAPATAKEKLRQQMLESPHLADREAVLRAQTRAHIPCPACGGQMERKLENFSIGADGYGGLTSIGLPEYRVDLYACPHCGKVELYTAQFKTPEEQEAEGPAFVICPECGKEHSPAINCPTCAMRAARGGRISFDSAPKAKKGPKPPWER